MIIKSAVISECGKFRYRLSRHWAPGRVLTFVMLNPSTADAAQDDPTIRKCAGFATRLGYAGIEVVNLFAYRATKPRDLYLADPLLTSAIGPRNDATLRQIARQAAHQGIPIACAWGAHARDLRRVEDVVRDLRAEGAQLAALALTADGIPRHPLMLPYSSKLELFE